MMANRLLGICINIYRFGSCCQVGSKHTPACSLFRLSYFLLLIVTHLVQWNLDKIQYQKGLGNCVSNNGSINCIEVPSHIQGCHQDFKLLDKYNK